MMSTIQTNINSTQPIPKLLPGLEGLAAYVDHDMMLYLLRQLYKMVFRSQEEGENKQELYRRIKFFEEEANIPGFLSAMPVDKLLEELEDAQFYYPIGKREVNFPIFH